MPPFLRILLPARLADSSIVRARSMTDFKRTRGGTRTHTRETLTGSKGLRVLHLNHHTTQQKALGSSRCLSNLHPICTLAP